MDLSRNFMDRVDLLKADGTKIFDQKASVQKNKVFMSSGDFIVESGDLILRKMSNGGEETYRVIDPGFHEKFHSIAAHYQMDVQKLGIPEAKTAVNSITYNINGNNARINQHSIDNSSNVVNIDARAIQYIESLRQEISSASISQEDRSSALEIVDEVEKYFQSGSPKKSVVSALLKALPHVANVTAIAASIASMLA